MKALLPISLLLFLAAGVLLPSGIGQEKHGAIAAPFNQIAHSAHQSQHKPYKDGELLVRFKPGKAARAAVLHRAMGARDHRRAGFARVVRLPVGMTVDQALEWYRAQPEVAYAEYNYRVRKADTTPNDTYFDKQWWLRNTGQTLNGVTGTAGADIGAPAAWDLRTGGTIIVALVDTGVDYTHPDLSGNIWSNAAEAGGVDGVDDDGNGYVDDIRGWNFANNNNNPMDDDIDGHGTHVAGIIGAVSNNSLGAAGINWSVKLMPLKFLDANGDGDLADAAEAIRYAADNGAKIINASYSYPQRCGSDTPSITERQAIEHARTKDALVVVAAGNFRCDNDRFPSYPSSHKLDNIISVAASNQRDEFASAFSNYGARSVHLFAPGDNIFSTIRNNLTGMVSNISGYDYIEGTSMAAPMVSGILSLLAAHDNSLGWKAKREILLKSVDKKEALATRSVTGGRAHAFNALSLNLATSTPVQPSHFTASKVSQTQVNLTWQDDSTIEDEWVVERKAGSSGSFIGISRLASDGSMQVAYSDTSVNAAEGTLHSYRVKAANTNGDSDPTAEIAITTPLAAPTSLAASAINENSVRLTWVDHSASETSYRVERALGAGIFSEIANLAANTRQFEDAGLITDREYRYRVRAHNADVGFSGYSNTLTITITSSSTPSSLAPPTNLVADATSQTGVRLSWQDNSSLEASYRIERAVSGGGFSEVANLAANKTQYEDSGLIQNTTYSYRVRAFSTEAGFSSYSNVATVKTLVGASGGTKVGCFVATAAYGSALHPRVNALRQFRDVYLLPNAVGRAFVNAYYRASPPLADFIARHDWLRAGVRTLLWPLAWLAEALIPDAHAGTFFQPPEKSVAEAAQADKIAVELLVERQLLVKVKPAHDADALLRAHGASHIKEISPRLFLVDFADLAARTSAERELNASPQVEYAEANRVVSRPRTR